MAAEAFKAKFEEELTKYKQLEKGNVYFYAPLARKTYLQYFLDREKYINNRQQLESQFTENDLVMKV